MTTGIVLAGGRSARFDPDGGRSKLDAELSGQTVLDRTIDAVRTVFVELIVVGRASGSRDDVTYLPDAAPFAGPLAGIRLGLDAAADPTVLVIGGDMPLARPDVLALLADQLLDPAVDAAVLGDGDRWRPLPVALRTAVARRAITAAFAGGDRSIRRGLDGLRLRIIAERDWRAIDPDGDTLLDVDTAADLAVAERRLRSRA